MTLILITLLLILWELLGRFLNIPEYILPLPLSIMKAFAENFSLLLSHGKYTYLGLSIWLIGYYFEVVGDRQLKDFLAKPENKGKIMKEGL